jgi:hypothetical protein
MLPKPRMRPFPLPFSIGTDICHIPRVAALLKKNNGAFTVKLLRKVLNPMEQELYRKKMFVAYAIADRLGGIEYYPWRGLPRTPADPPNPGLDSEGKAPGSGKSEQKSDEKGMDNQTSTQNLQVVASFWRNMSEEVLDNNVNGLATWLAGR